LRKEIEKTNRKHKGEMEEIVSEHQSSLNEIERRVKRQIGEKVAIIDTVDANIQQQLMKIEHARKMTASYQKKKTEKDSGGDKKNNTQIVDGPNFSLTNR